MPSPSCLRRSAARVATARRSLSRAPSNFIALLRGENRPRTSAGRTPTRRTFRESGNETTGSALCARSGGREDTGARCSVALISGVDCRQGLPEALHAMMDLAVATVRPHPVPGQKSVWEPFQRWLELRIMAQQNVLHLRVGHPVDPGLGVNLRTEVGGEEPVALEPP